MRILTRQRLLVGLATAAVAASGGAAYAATQSGGTSQQALVSDVAARLHVSPNQLTSAVKAALIDRLQAEVKAGKLTQARADRLERRIENSKRLPLMFAFGRPGPLRAAGRVGLPAAAHYLGLTTPQLLAQLRSGKSLAQIATARGKSVSGLEQAIMAAEKARLSRAVANGHITQAQEQKLLSRLSARIDRLVNRTGWGRAPHPAALKGGPMIPGGAALLGPPAGGPAGPPAGGPAGLPGPGGPPPAA